MSEEKSIFERNDFKNLWFYYHLPFYSYVKKSEIGEKINKFKGVIICINNKNFLLLQSISLSLKENIYILIEKESDILSSNFKDEILSSGNVSLYIDNKLVLINCLNKEIDKPINYYCLLLSGK